MARNFPGYEKQMPITKTTPSSKAPNYNGSGNKELPRQKNAESIHLHQTSTARYAKGMALRKGRKRVRERGTQV